MIIPMDVKRKGIVMDYSVGTMEYRLLTLIWENEPVSSMRLVEICRDVFDWKKSTTYTMLKRLQDKGLVSSVKTIVTSLVSQAEVRTKESSDVIEESFGGSLPNFIAAFLGGNTISDEEAEEIKRLIDSYKR